MTGLSRPRLERMRRVLAAYVERGELPGAVTLVSHGDDVHVEAYGTLAAGGGPPMQRDTVFRAASLVKPVTAVAAMILVEQCDLRLDAAIDPWIPELANRRVLRTLDSELDDTVPAERPITVRDLLTSTMGFGSVMAMPGIYPIQRAIAGLKIGGDGPPIPALAPNTATWIANLGSLPLIAQPGSRYLYNTSSDVLGVLIGRVAGTSLGAFMRERIFEPLRMSDSGFSVPPAALPRLPVAYTYDDETKTFAVFDDNRASGWSTPPPFESGAGGLVTTVDDYFRFCRMLLDGGSCDGERVLSRAAVELMTVDQLTAGQRKGAEPFFGTDSSWGFGMAVYTKRGAMHHVPGRFGWDGGLGLSAYTDPVNRAIGILMTQRLVTSPEPPHLYEDFWTLAYGALE